VNALDAERLESALKKIHSDPLGLTDAEVETFMLYATVHQRKAWEHACTKATTPERAPTSSKRQQPYPSPNAIAEGIVRTVKNATAPLITEQATQRQTIRRLEAELTDARDRLLVLEAAVAAKVSR
jgi:hypothetical protein